MNRVILEWSKGIHAYSSLLIYPDRSKFTDVLLCICTHRHIIPSSAEVPTSSYFSDPDTDDECLRKEAIYAWPREQPVPNEARQRIPWGTNPRKKKKRGTKKVSHLSEMVEGDKHLCQEDWLCSRGGPMENHHKQAHGDRNENSSGLERSELCGRNQQGTSWGKGSVLIVTGV